MINLDKQKLKEELLNEKNLIDVYKTSRVLPFSKQNKKIVLIFSVVSLILSTTITSEELFQSITSLSSSLIGTVVTLTGFLIAGYTIFCSVMSPKLSILLFNFGKIEHDLSELKRTHLKLIRVFIYCLFYTSILLIINAFSGTSNLIFKFTEFIFEDASLIFHFTNYLIFNFIIIFFIFLIVQLGAFIFNIYHAIMTAIVAYPELDKFKISNNSKKENPH
ncbi:hypothetical protein G9F32_12890 [Acinetobacter sp. 194]|uniref:hypothetical protein n=1 Tax=Acinetobacter shaoyimingii TaxID=2715164 RepID=UPI001409E541|nr:hypothetical protein [Acinetobacter shaoyimingii]NHB58906.1 hypothetical protein [Acinetobacter shaoyimingii]